MKCPRCTHQNPPDVKFCSDCRQRMGIPDPGCNTVDPTESRYCHHCGQRLTKTNGFFRGENSSRPRLSDTEKAPLRPSALGARKYVAVLFSNLSGCTIYAQRLDPEEVKEIIARIFQNGCQVKKLIYLE